MREKLGQNAQCKQCSKILKTIKGFIKGLHTHLKTVHEIDLLKHNAARDDAKTSKNVESEAVPRKKITDYFSHKYEKTLQDTLARITARDDMLFEIFCKSADLRECLRVRGFSDVPSSPNTMRKNVIDYSNRICSFIKDEMANQKINSKKFSLSFDEWSSTRNLRYMNIIIYGSCSKNWNLGLVRVPGTMPATKCVELVETRLRDHGLSLNSDIVCITTDGASVMTKVGQLIQAEQLCYAHGVQLSVLNVLYKREDIAQDRPQAVEISEVIAETSTNCTTTQSMNQETDDTDEAGVEDTNGLTVDCDDEAESLLVPLLSPNVQDLIQ